LAKFEFKFRWFVCFTFIFVRLENQVYLSNGVQLAGAAWQAAVSIMTGVGDLVQMTGDGRTDRVLSDRTIERSGDAMCNLHRTRGDDEHAFFLFSLKIKFDDLSVV
jgi:hypothetical protein